jgi:DNA polymerase-3 subunit beta
MPMARAAEGETVMQIVIQRTPLLEACKLAERAVFARPVNKILGNLLLDARDGGCFLTGANQSVAVRLPVPAWVERTGPVLVPAREFLGILREVAEGELTIVAEPGRVLVRGHDAEFDLRSDDASRFPPLPSCPDGPADDIACEPLRLAIQRTLFAAGRAPEGHSLRGVLWEVEADRVRLVATDNRRLAVAEIRARAHPESGLPRQAILPLEAMQMLERLAGAQGGTMKVRFRQRQVFFRAAGALLCSRLVEGSFPPWRKAMAWEPRYRLLLPVGSFLSGVKQAAVLRDKADSRLLLRFQSGRVTLRSRQAGTGQANVRQALVFPCTRESVEVAFNPIYLAELLSVLDSEGTVELDLRDPDAPALFCAGENYRHLLMPLRRERMEPRSGESP